MNKNNIDWEEFAKKLLWHQIIYEKNSYSGYEIMLVDGPEGRGIKKGDIGSWSIQSYLDPFSYRPLSWKELALELGIFTEHLTPDGHDCKKCPKENGCRAYFKYNEDHERCNGWEEQNN